MFSVRRKEPVEGRELGNIYVPEGGEETRGRDLHFADNVRALIEAGTPNAHRARKWQLAPSPARTFRSLLLRRLDVAVVAPNFVRDAA